MKHLIYIVILLGVVNPASAQDTISVAFTSQWAPERTDCVQCELADKSDPDTSVVVMLKIILSNKTSVHFYRKGLKRGDQYWYFDRNRIKKLPGNWFIWETRPIKQ